MTFTDFFIRRPVLATALSLVIFLLGVRAYLGMTVREYPKMTNTTVIVSTIYAGASPQTVQGFLTTPLERVIATAPGIDYMTSVSAEGASTITAYMKLNYSPNAAVANIQSKIQQVVNKLPTGSQLPVINVTVGDTTDLMYIAFYSSHMTQQQITDYLLRVVQPSLVSVPGVSQAQIVPAGTTMTLRTCRPKRRTRPNMPGRNTAAGLGTIACTRMLRVAGFTVASMACTCPTKWRCGNASTRNWIVCPTCTLGTSTCGSVKLA